MMHRTARDVLRDALSMLALCTKWAALFGALTLLGFLISGGANLARYNVSATQVLVAYVIGTLCAGLALGLLRPWLGHWLGRMGAAMLVCAVMVFIAGLIRSPEATIQERLIISIVVGIVAGPVYAWAFRPLDGDEG